MSFLVRTFVNIGSSNTEDQSLSQHAVGMVLFQNRCITFGSSSKSGMGRKTSPNMRNMVTGAAIFIALLLISSWGKTPFP